MLMFAEMLKQVVESARGAKAAMLMDTDGIEVAHYVAGAAQGAKWDIETIGIEFSVVAKGVRNALASLDGGEGREIVVRGEKMTLVMHFVTTEYVVVLAVDPGLSVGKSRYRLRLALPELEAALS